jgi:hypothetical protein
MRTNGVERHDQFLLETNALNRSPEKVLGQHGCGRGVREQGPNPIVTWYLGYLAITNKQFRSDSIPYMQQLLRQSVAAPHMLQSVVLCFGDVIITIFVLFVYRPHKDVVTNFARSERDFADSVKVLII